MYLHVTCIRSTRYYCKVQKNDRIHNWGVHDVRYVVYHDKPDNVLLNRESANLLTGLLNTTTTSPIQWIAIAREII